MADAPVVHIGDNSPEYVAYLLLGRLLDIEERIGSSRQSYLDAYAECLLTVKAPASRFSHELAPSAGANGARISRLFSPQIRNG
jgi:hypothetical protein